MSEKSKSKSNPPKKVRITLIFENLSPVEDESMLLMHLRTAPKDMPMVEIARLLEVSRLEVLRGLNEMRAKVDYIT